MNETEKKLNRAKQHVKEIELDDALGGEVNPDWIGSMEWMIDHIEKLEQSRNDYRRMCRRYKLRAAKYKKELDHFKAVEQFIDETQN